MTRSKALLMISPSTHALLVSSTLTLLPFQPKTSLNVLYEKHIDMDSYLQGPGEVVGKLVCPCFVGFGQELKKRR